MTDEAAAAEAVPAAHAAQPDEPRGYLSLQVDLGELVAELWARRYVWAALVAVVTLTTFFTARALPNYYEASTLVAPASEEESNSLSKMSSQVGGLAAIAGLDLSGVGGSEVDRTTLALAVLQSRDFLTSFIERNDLIVPILAPGDWNEETRTLSVDESRFDPATGTWFSEWLGMETRAPTPYVAYLKFLDEVLDVDQEDESGLIRIQIQHASPAFAEQWLVMLMHDLNERLRARDQRDAQAMVDYLRSRLEMVSVAEVRQAFFQLVEQQIKRLMMTEARAEYVFETVDPAFYPEFPAGPNRLLMLVVGVLFGVFLSVGIAALRVAR